MPDNQGAGTRARLQKQKDNRGGKPLNHGTKGAKVYGAGDKGFVLTVEILVSDLRRRDLDGALATICDIIVALGRQLEADTGDNGQGKASGKR
tara:strand:- start:177 stop:455 length:279 start_codon:yes stop_codon:yes gene_type:complete